MLIQPTTPPQSAKYIQVRYQDVPSATLYHLLQKAIVLDLFPNADVQIDRNAPITQQQVAGRISLAQHKKIPYTAGTLANGQRVVSTIQSLASYPTQINVDINSSPLAQNIFYDVYGVLNSDFADADQLS